MEIENLNRNLSDSKVTEDLRKGKIHIVCVAVNALTFFNAIAVQSLGISSELATLWCKEVNEKNETGTLYPKFNITLIPVPNYENRNDWDNETIMIKHIKDAFLANSKYIKSSEIIFALEQVKDSLANHVLRKVASELQDNGILKHIYYNNL
jgi:hypothetical protein